MFARWQQNQVDHAREDRAGFFWTHTIQTDHNMRFYVSSFQHSSHFVPMKFGKCVYCDSPPAVLSLSFLGTHRTETGSPRTKIQYISLTNCIGTLLIVLSVYSNDTYNCTS